MRTRTGLLETEYADINTLVNGNLTSDNIQSLVISGEKFSIADGFIKNAMIESLAFDKITGFDINTTKLTVHSEDGKSTWVDNTIQISDENRARVQIGEDASGDYNMYLWDASGNMLWNATGVTESGLNDGIIKDVAVAEDANISGSKLDIESVVKEVNGATTKIKSSSVLFDDENQTLDIVFNTMTTTITNNLTESKAYADGKADTALSDAKSYADSTAGATLTSAQQYALNQANSALANAKSYADTSASTTLTSAKSYADSVVDGIDIGGRNYLRFTQNLPIGTGNNPSDGIGKFSSYGTLVSTEYGIKLIFAGNSNASISVPLAFDGCIESGEELTISFTYRGNITNVGLIYFLQRTAPNVAWSFPSYNLNNNEEWHQFSATWIATDANVRTCYQMLLFYGLNAHDSSKWIEIKKGTLKLEKGNKPTDWMPAPEDTEAEITNLTEITTTQSTQISTMQGQITALITEDTNIKGDYNALVSRYNATVADVDSIKTTIGEHTTLIDANTDDITAVSSRVTTVETDLTGIKTRVSATETAIAKKADGTTVDALTSRVATAESTLEGFETSLTVVEQTVSDNYTELKAYTDTAKASAISTAASDATTKANNALASAKSDATTKANNAFSNASLLAEMANGELLYKDPTFLDGSNGVGWYNNSNTTSVSDVTVTRISSPDGCPTASGHCMQIKVTGTTTSPGYGGIHQKLNSRANAHFVVKYLINLPVGYTLKLKSNSMGTGYTDKWLTSAEGTGTWQTYIREVKCGSTGTFSTGGHVYVSGSPAPSSDSPLVWYLGAIYAYDITQASTVQDQIDSTNATVATHTETISSHDTRITANEAAIALKVSTTDFNSYKTTVTGQISTAKSEAISTAASDATTKANSAKSEAISAAASDATTKANNALASAKSDATTKANNALTSAKSYTDAEITVVNESLTTTNQEITVMKGQIALKVEQTDIDTAVTTVKSYADNQIKNNDPVIIGTQTAATGTWTGVAPFASLADGQRITYWLPYAGSGNATLNLTLSGGGTTGAVNCYYGGTTRLTTHYPAGSSIRLIYRKGVSIGGTSYTGWWADANYDSNTYDRTKYNGAVKASAAIVAGNLIVGNSSGYHHLKTGGTFDINYPILYAGSAISSGSTGTNNYIVMPVTITTTQSLTLTAYKALYIKGTLSGSTFTPVSTAPITQTVPTSEDGYYYILLGTAYSTTAFYLLAEHPIYKYVNGAFQQAITQFTSYSTTTQMNSAITAAKNEINLSVSQKYATIDNVTGIETRLSTAESNITAQASSIALCVKESAVTGNYLIGKINLSSTTATIAASHINLAGAVTISALASDTKTQLDTAATNASTALTNAATAQSTANTASTNATTALGYAQYHYGTCATAAATAAKVVTLSGFKLYTGAKISIKFTYANTAASPKLNVNSTGAKTIRANGANLTATSKYNWRAGSLVNFVYDGTYWVMEESTANYLWSSSSDVTMIDGGMLYTKSVKAAQIDVDDLFAQEITATHMTITDDCMIGRLALSNSNVNAELAMSGTSGRGSMFYCICEYDETHPEGDGNNPAYFLRMHDKIGEISNTYFSVDEYGQLVASAISTIDGADLDELGTRVAAITDYVVKQGTIADPNGNGDWRYRYWNSGKAEAWRCGGPYSFSGWAACGNVYYLNTYITYPVSLFASILHVTLTPYQPNGHIIGISQRSWNATDSSSTSVKDINFTMYNYSNASLTNVYINAYAFGTWK